MKQISHNPVPNCNHRNRRNPRSLINRAASKQRSVARLCRKAALQMQDQKDEALSLRFATAADAGASGLQAFVGHLEGRK